MKVNGVENKRDVKYGPLCLRRGTDEKGEPVYLAFYAQPVWTMEGFQKAVPYPENTCYYFTKEGKVKDFEAQAWKDKEAVYWRKRWGYIVLKSLEPSNLELDNCSLDDPDTWDKVEDSLRAELNPFEFRRVMDMVEEANAIDEQKLEANASTFLQRQVEAIDHQSGLNGEAASTPSTEPALDSE